jgi:hypothetical protein
VYFFIQLNPLTFFSGGLKRQKCEHMLCLVRSESPLALILRCYGIWCFVVMVFEFSFRFSLGEFTSDRVLLASIFIFLSRFNTLFFCFWWGKEDVAVVVNSSLLTRNFVKQKSILLFSWQIRKTQIFKLNVGVFVTKISSRNPQESLNCARWFLLD